MGNLYYKSKNGRAALRQYLKQLVAELRLKSFKGKEARILEPIAVRMGRSTAEIRQVLLRATKLMRVSNLNRKTAAEFIHKLSVIRQAARDRDR